jgi:gamma-butyrobetaine dioxygenase
MQIPAVHAGMDSLRVSWEGGNQTSIHYISLRDSCSCDECRHPDVGDRLLDSTLIPVDIRPERVELTSSGQVEIHWSPDHHHSTWDAELIGNLPEVAYETIINDGEALLNWLRRLREYGVTLVRDVPIRVAEVAKVAERIRALRTSNFGTVFNGESKPEPNALAYTAHALPPHTDLVARE